MFIEFTKNIMIECDESKINRLFNNLIKNAVESVCEKKNQKIQISVKKNTNKVIINFEDSGIGFPVEKEILFEPYITNKKGGTGLGLAICKKIIEEHNGDIKLFNSELSEISEDSFTSFDEEKKNEDEDDLERPAFLRSQKN